MQLALGSGNWSQAYKNMDYITIDAVEKSSVDYTQEIPPLPDEILEMGAVFKHVEGMHFWEHLYHWQAVELAEQIVSILKPGGVLILELPNIQKAVNYMAGVEIAPDDPRYTMWALYGAQTDPDWIGNPHQAHKWGYTPHTITKQLKDAGFREVEILRATMRLPDVRDMRVRAYV